MPRNHLNISHLPSSFSRRMRLDTIPAPAKETVDEDLLRQVLEEVRGLRADLQRQKWLPDEPWVHALIAQYTRPNKGED